MRRVYFISIPGSFKRWCTTNCFAAMEFTHSFGTVGFNLFSKVEESPEINEVIAL